MISKCANPSCTVEFEYGKGQFFRFHKAPGEDGRPANTHSIQHYWLCGECARIYCLEHKRDTGILLRTSYGIATPAEEPVLVGVV